MFIVKWQNPLKYNSEKDIKMSIYKLFFVYFNVN